MIHTSNTNNYINENRLLQTFLNLVKIDSESYHEREMAEFLKKELKNRGLFAREDDAALKLREICKETLGQDGDVAGNVWACLPGNLKNEEENRKRAILFSAHMDTVHPGNGKKAIVYEDGIITSDGTTVLGADDAAGLAEILEVLQIIKEYDLPHPDIEILFAAAEEPYCQGSRLFDFQQFHARSAYVLDLNGAVGTAAMAAPSILSLSICVHGKSSHAGFSPEDGIHAIYIAARAISELPYGHVEEDTTMNLGTIHGGHGKNIVPEEVILTGEIRSMNAKKAEYWLRKISEVFQKNAESLGGTVSISVEKEVEAYCVSKEAPVTQIFLKAAKNLNLPLQLVETFGGSDNNNFNSSGIQGLVLANAMKDVHTTKESTHIEEMIKAASLLLEIIHVAVIR